MGQQRISTLLLTFTLLYQLPSYHPHDMLVDVPFVDGLSFGGVSSTHVEAGNAVVTSAPLEHREIAA